MTISGLAMIDGNALGSGGAIFSLESLALKNCVISGNTTANTGGAVYVNAAAAKIANCEITGNTATGDGLEGGVCVIAGKSISITGSEILGNTATKEVGGMFADVLATGTGITLNNDLISGNSAPNCGGVRLTDANPAAAAKVILSSCTISGNASTNGPGGGVQALSGNFVFNNDALLANQANGATVGDGGGLYSKLANSVTISGGLVEGNSTKMYGGGAALVGAFPVNVSGVTFAGNTAADTGGGIVTNTVTSLKVINSRFEGNSANVGGALDIGRTGNTLLSGDLVTNNTASNYAGGIHVIQNTASTTTTIKNSKIIGNVSQDEAGGAAFQEVSVLNISGSVFADNTALNASSGGGAYLVNVSSFTISGSTFVENHADYEGGGLFVAGSNGTFITTKITGNIADNAGGGSVRTAARFPSGPGI